MRKLILLCSLLFSTIANAKEPYKIGGIKVYEQYNYDLFFKGTILEKYCKPLIVKEVSLTAETSGVLYSTIREFSSQYPKEFLDKHLRGIFLLSQINCSGKPYGGTYSGKSIYVSFKDYLTRGWLIKALHHELSSVLAKEGRFPYYGFGAISGFDNYDGTIEQECLAHPNSCRIVKDELLEKGFIYDYGRTSFENDYNVYAEMLFDDRESLEGYARQYPLVEKKLDFIKKFYTNMGVTFD